MSPESPKSCVSIGILLRGGTYNIAVELATSYLACRSCGRLKPIQDMDLHMDVCPARDENRDYIKPADLRRLLAHAGHTPRILGRTFKSTLNLRRALVQRKNGHQSESETLVDESAASQTFHTPRCATPSIANRLPIVEPPSPMLHAVDEGKGQQGPAEITPCRL